MIRHSITAACAALACAVTARSVTLETDAVRLELGADACAKSLVVRATGEELLIPGEKVPFLAAVQDRPFHNEWKLIHPNMRTHPRADDILETLRRWNEVRRKGLPDAWRTELKDVSREHHLYRNERGECELVRWEMVSDGLDPARPVRTFAFTRGGETYLAYWHVSGAGPVTLDLGDGPRSYPADRLRYARSRKSVAELKASLSTQAKACRSRPVCSGTACEHWTFRVRINGRM